jgi:hypothetical protein
MTPREYLIQRGVIRPGPYVQGVTLMRWLEVPTVRLDELGRRRAAKAVVQPEVVDARFFDQRPGVE